MGKEPKAKYRVHWAPKLGERTKCGLPPHRYKVVLLGSYPMLKAITCKTCLFMAQDSQGRRLNAPK